MQILFTDEDGIITTCMIADTAYDVEKSETRFTNIRSDLYDIAVESVGIYQHQLFVEELYKTRKLDIRNYKTYYYGDSDDEEQEVAK